MITRAQIDLTQGTDQQDRPFGYVAGSGGGFFFSWRETLNATLASVEVDEVDGDGGLSEEDVVEYLRQYLPTTERGQMWPEAVAR